MKSRTLIQQNISHNDSLNNDFDEIDIEKTAEKLVRCSNNRTEFQSYINRINNIVLGDENNEVLNKVTNKEPIESKNSFYKSDRSNSRQFISKGSISPSVSSYTSKFQKKDSKNELASYDKSPNSKKFVMEDINDVEDQKTSGGFKLTNKSSLKNSKDDINIDLNSNNLRYNDVNANSKYYYPVDTNSAYDSDLSNEPAQWNDRSNRNTLFESKKSPQYDEGRGRQVGKFN